MLRWAGPRDGHRGWGCAALPLQAEAWNEGPGVPAACQEHGNCRGRTAAPKPKLGPEKIHGPLGPQQVVPHTAAPTLECGQGSPIT